MTEAVSRPTNDLALSGFSFAASSWAALGTCLFVQSHLGRSVLFCCAPVLALGGAAFAVLGIRRRPVMGLLTIAVALGAVAIVAATVIGLMQPEG
ncbi:MAG: hypothetical protein JST54_24175 [Deltaproteobacteria bacterium]|nr:hypothetical protein [Deltaproteobacteria bacterium]